MTSAPDLIQAIEKRCMDLVRDKNVSPAVRQLVSKERLSLIFQTTNYRTEIKLLIEASGSTRTYGSLSDDYTRLVAENQLGHALRGPLLEIERFLHSPLTWGGRAVKVETANWLKVFRRAQPYKDLYRTPIKQILDSISVTPPPIDAPRDDFREREFDKEVKDQNLYLHETKSDIEESLYGLMGALGRALDAEESRAGSLHRSLKDVRSDWDDFMGRYPGIGSAMQGNSLMSADLGNEYMNFLTARDLVVQLVRDEMRLENRRVSNGPLKGALAGFHSSDIETRALAAREACAAVGVNRHRVAEARNGGRNTIDRPLPSSTAELRLELGIKPAEQTPTN